MHFFSDRHGVVALLIGNVCLEERVRSVGNEICSLNYSRSHVMFGVAEIDADTPPLAAVEANLN